VSMQGSLAADHDQVLSASAVMAAGTLISRLSGFVRAAMIAAALGIHLRADQFNVANTIPNMLYILLAGGVFNTVLVPQLVRSMQQDRDGGDAYANRVLTLSLLALAAATAAVVAAAPWVMRVFLEPEWFTPALAAQRNSLIDLSRYCLAQIFFYGMFVLLSQILNARGKFGPTMWAPIANNVVSIAVLTLYLAMYGVQGGSGAYTNGEELLLGLGSTAGIIVQTALLLPYLRGTGLRLRLRFDFRHTGLGHTLRLGLWTVLFVIVNQVAYTVVVRLATNGSAQEVVAGSAGATGYSVYSNAYLLVMVPHSVITVSLVTAMLPRISRLAADHRLADVGTELANSLRLSLGVIIPFALGLAVLSAPLATLVFGWGAAAGQTLPLGLTLAAFAPGLVLFTVHYLALRGFYALEDTRTPFFVQCSIAAVNIGLAIVLTGIASPSGYAVMLALAYDGSYLVGAAISLSLLAHRLGGLGRATLAVFAARVVSAAAAAAALAWLAAHVAAGLAPQLADRTAALLALLVGGCIGVAAFVALARALRISEVSAITRLLSGRLQRSRTTV
jgi:putative peptidoglycan lipid II flippase